MRDEGRVLSVLYSLPGGSELPGGSVLSFLSPEDEARIRAANSDGILSARAIAAAVKKDALKFYVDMIASIGATKPGGKETLRQALRGAGGVSYWWFHKVSEKDCESEQTFRLITDIFIIREAALKAGAKKIVIYGGASELCCALRRGYTVECISAKKIYGLGYYMRGLSSRAIYLLSAIREVWSVNRYVRKHAALRPDVVLAGFWDWSVKEDAVSGRLRDTYYKMLPETLSSKGLKRAWFLWFDPNYKREAAQKSHREMLEPVGRHEDVVMLQSFLSAGDVLKAVFNLRPLLTFLRYFVSGDFRKIFLTGDADILPILKGPLLNGFINYSIAREELIMIASERAFRENRPKASLSFLEFFLYSRAFYSGARAGSPETAHFAMQHAGYSREKTFMILDPAAEYRGEPDSCPVPTPDGIFAMGELGRDIFVECGFRKDSVYLTGSARYDDLKINKSRKAGGGLGSVNILIVPAIEINQDIEMIGAVCLAAKDMPQVKLSLRNHPFEKISSRPQFIPYNGKVNITSGSLDEDLNSANIVIFSYSTVAAEAVIRGIPVWQWVPIDFNGSVFRDIDGAIRSFRSAEELSGLLKHYIKDPEKFVPSDDISDLVVRECFYATDGKAHERIADRILSIIKEK